VAVLARDDVLDAVEVVIDETTTEVVVLGVTDAWPGVVPEELVVEDDAAGSSRLGFVLKRPPGDHPDLQSGLLVRYWHGGNGTDGSAELKWSGRIASTPDSSDVDDDAIRVDCEGAQAELDDDSFVGAWLLVDQSRWKDLRSAPVVDLNVSDPLRAWMKYGPSSAGSATVEQGATMLAIPQGATFWGRQKVGAYLDARRWPSFQQWYLEWYSARSDQDTADPETGPPDLLPLGGLDLVVCGATDPHFMDATRVEHWRIAAADLGWHGTHRIDPTGDIRPMPYLGLFLETIPPTHLVSRELAVPAGRVVHVTQITTTAPHAFTIPRPDAGDDNGQRVLMIVVTNDSRASGPLFEGFNEASVSEFASTFAASSGHTSRHANAVWTGTSSTLATAVYFSRVKAGGAGRSFELNPFTASDPGANLLVTVLELEGWQPATGTWSFAQGNTANPQLTLASAAAAASPQGTAWLAAFDYLRDTAGSPPTGDATAAMLGADHAGHGWSRVGAGDLETAANPFNPSFTTYPAKVGRQAVWIDATGHAGGTSRPGFTTGNTGQGSPPSGGTDSLRGLVGALVEDDPQTAMVEEDDLSQAMTAVAEFRVLFPQVKLALDADLLGDDGSSGVPPDRLIRDARTLAPRLSTDESLIGTPEARLVEYVADAPLTPREVMEAANATSGWRLRVDPDRRLRFDALPTVSTVEIGDWDGWAFEDGSGDTLDATFNGAWLVGQDGVGRPVLSKLGTGESLPITDVAVAEADVSGSGWAMEGDADGRAVIGEADYVLDHAVSGQALRLRATAPDPAARAIPWGEGVVAWSQRLGGAFEVGVEYRLRLNLRCASTLWTEGVQRLVRLYVYGSNMRLLSRELPVVLEADATYEVVWLPFVAVDTRMDLYVVAGCRGVTGDERDVLWIDELSLTRITTTPLDRRKMRRTRITTVQKALTPALADRVNAAFLVEASRPQFSGSVVIRGPAARLRSDGSRVEASWFLGQAGELIHLANVPNPEGGLGRDARLVGCSYDPEQDEATLTFDNATHRLDRLLARVDGPQV
jgi:hypothetical protein